MGHVGSGFGLWYTYDGPSLNSVIYFQANIKTILQIHIISF